MRNRMQDYNSNFSLAHSRAFWMITYYVDVMAGMIFPGINVKPSEINGFQLN